MAMAPLQDILLCAGALVSGAAMAAAAANDVRRYMIPNRLCAAVAAGFALAAPALPAATVVGGLAVGVVVFVVGAALFWRGWLGGGDVKLGAAVALWAGPALFSNFASAVALAGAVLAGFMISPLRAVMPAAPADLDAGLGARQPMPFGLPLAVGGLLVLALQLQTHL